MSDKLEAFQALLVKMRDEFLGELSERCNRLDDLVLQLEKSPADRDTFNELFRTAHSLKGSGGTHGLTIITTICHHLENLLTEADAKQKFEADFASHALSFVDLLRRVENAAVQDTPNYVTIEADLEKIRQTGLQSFQVGLIAESSPIMSRLYQQALHTLPVKLTVVDNGIAALERLLHEHYDFVIVGREVKDLNGIAVMVALRASQARNQNIRAILVSSKAGEVPEHAKFYAVISRDKKLADNLLAGVQAMLRK